MSTWTARGRTREPVVDEADGVAVVAFLPLPNAAQPRHLHRRREHGEGRLGRAFEDACKTARDDWRFEPAYWDVLAMLGADLRHDQERSLGNHVDVIQRRCRLEASCWRTLAPLPEFTDGLYSLPQGAFLSQQF